MQVLLVLVRGNKEVNEFSKEILSPLNIIFYIFPTVTSF